MPPKDLAALVIGIWGGHKTCLTNAANIIFIGYFFLCLLLVLPGSALLVNYFFKIGQISGTRIS
jgi:hypothetical protein